MVKNVGNRSKAIGLSPGTLVHVGEKKTEKAKITLTVYDDSTLHEEEPRTVEQCYQYKGKSAVTWINIDGIHEVEIIKKFGECFDLHPLILEDILNTDQRPKLEDFDDYLVIILKIYSEAEDNRLKPEQVSIILGSNFVISFQEKEGTVFNNVRARIKNKKGRIRKMGSDYLAYALVDALVDSYFLVLEKVGEKLESIEEVLIADPKPETLKGIHNLKREMIFLRKSVWPLREVLNILEKDESPLIMDSTRVYLRDVYDHTIQLIDTIETYRDILTGMLDLYLSTVSNKMNEIMKVLTIIATIFIPLTFITGIYGMNFNFMPELGWRFGYPVVWLIMVSVGLLMFFFFWRKKWL
jgi:magnesium transporter